jgi:general secretion pathway protein C
LVVERFLRGRVWPFVIPPVALVALLNAQAVGELIGIPLEPDALQLAAAPLSRASAAPHASTRVASADPILTRNPFDHVTGSLRPPPTSGSGEGTDAPPDMSDPWSAPKCEGVQVNVIMASDDPQWSFASISGSDGKSELRRRGGEVDGKKLVFVGGDRVWLDHGGSMCQAEIHDAKKHATPAPAPRASTSAAPGGARGGAKPVDPDIKKGIRKVSDTQFQIDRGVVDRILENQADLMRQARIVPEQENGRVVGIRLMGVRPDSLLSTLGMQNGDRLQTINGFEMASPEKALEAYARLRTADKLTISINRGGKAMNLDYDIR